MDQIYIWTRKLIFFFKQNQSDKNWGKKNEPKPAETHKRFKWNSKFELNYSKKQQNEIYNDIIYSLAHD